MAKRKTKTAAAKKTSVAPNPSPESPVTEPVVKFTETGLPDEAETAAAEVKPSTVRRTLRGILAMVGAGLVVGLLLVISFFGYEYLHTDKVYAGITLAGQAVGGKDYVAAATPVLDYQTQLETDGIQFSYGEKTVTLPLKNEPEAIPLIEIAVDETVQTAFGYGRGTDPWSNLNDKLAALINGIAVPLQYTMQSETMIELLSAQFDDATTPYQNAALTLDDSGALVVTPHIDGTSFQWEAVMQQVADDLNTLTPLEYELSLKPDPALVTTTMADAALADAQRILDLAPLTLTYEDDSFTVETEELAGWLTLTDEGAAATREAQVILDEAAVRASLDTIAAEINIPVKEGRFSLDIVDDTVTLQQFEEGQDGLGVELDKTVTAISEALLTELSSTAALVVEVTHPRATPDSLENLGIKELLGTGETSFAGSPSNRIGNIQRGADLLNGLLIAPGETFSLLSILKPFDAANGWLPELVIKGNKLEKELGGGLCQVGSTAFRAAMMSGQEIVERRNHSWAVSYYDYNGKAGVDATIYDPSPDFKFKNTTEHYMLWRSRIEGYNIYFELWGTSDGRNGYFTEPVNYGYTSPGPTEEVVDESLAPGTRNCAQHAYTGVSASFDYIIDWPDGTQTVENFTSVYKAQPARCLVGPEAEAEEPAAETEDAATEETVTEEPATTEDTTDTTTEDTANTNTNKSKKKDKTN